MGGIEEGLLSESSEDIRVQISSSVTPAVVFSTFVAACGSLSYGFAVSSNSNVMGYKNFHTVFKWAARN